MMNPIGVYVLSSWRRLKFVIAFLVVVCIQSWISIPDAFHIFCGWIVAELLYVFVRLVTAPARWNV